MTEPKRITPETDTETRLNRIGEMQRDLAFLLTVNWCDVDSRIKARVLRHAVAEVKKENDDAE